MALQDYQKDWLIRQNGLDPSQYTLDADERNIIPKPGIDQPSLNSSPYEPKLLANPGFTPQNSGNQHSALGTIAESAAESAFPTFMGGMGAGVATAEANPLAHLAPPWSELGFGVGGALLGGMAGRAIQKQVEPESWQQDIAQAQQQHPVAGMIGELSTMPLGGLNPSLSNVGSAARAIPKLMTGMPTTAEELGNLSNVGIGAGIGAGQPLAQYAMSPEGTPFPTGQIASGALGGALFNNPNIIGTGLFGFHPNVSPQTEFTRDMLLRKSAIAPSEEENPQEVSATPTSEESTSDKANKELSRQAVAESINKFKTAQQRLTEFRLAKAEEAQQELQSQVDDLSSSIKANQLAQPEVKPAKVETNPTVLEAQARERETALQQELGATDLPERQTEAQLAGEERPKYSEESALTPQQEIIAKNLELEGLSGQLTPKWLQFAQRLGMLRNIKVEPDESITNVDTGKPVAGQTVARQGLNEVIAKVNPAMAGADTPVHEEFHSFINDMRNSPRGRDQTLVRKYDNLVSNSPDYINWKNARDARGLNSSVEEFQATNAGIEAVNRAIATDSPWQKWWKDFSAYAKTRFGEHGTLEDFQRVMHYKLLHDPSFFDVFGGASNLSPRIGAISNQEESSLGKSDYDRYNELQPLMREAMKNGDMDTFNKHWKEMEEIKNRNNGFPPTANSEKSNLVSPKHESVVDLLDKARTLSDNAKLEPKDAKEIQDILRKQVAWTKNSEVLKALKGKDFDNMDPEHWEHLNNLYNAEQFQYENENQKRKAETQKAPIKENVQAKEEIPAQEVKPKVVPTAPAKVEQPPQDIEKLLNQARPPSQRREMGPRPQTVPPAKAELEETPTAPLETRVAIKSPGEAVAKVQGIPVSEKMPEFQEPDRKRTLSAKEKSEKERTARMSWEEVEGVDSRDKAGRLMNRLKEQYNAAHERLGRITDRDEIDSIVARQQAIKTQMHYIEGKFGIEAPYGDLPKNSESSNLNTQNQEESTLASGDEPRLNWRNLNLKDNFEDSKLPYSSIGLTRTLLDQIIARHGEAGQNFSDAYHNYASDKDSMYGKYMTPILNAAKGLSKQDLNKVENMRILASRNGKDMSGYLTDKQEGLYNAIQDSMNQWQQDQKAANEPQSYLTPKGQWAKREVEIDPFYHPNKPSPQAIDILTEMPNSAQARELKNDFIDFQTSRGIPEENAKSTLESILKVYDSGNPNQSRFRDVRNAERTQLPDSWMRNDLLKNMNGFFNRVSADRAFHDNFETNPEVAKSIGITHDPWGKRYPGVDDNFSGELQGSTPVHNALEKVYGEPFDKDESNLKLANRIATSLFLGPLTNIHIAASSVANALQYLKPGEAIPAMAKALTNITDGYQKALGQGYSRQNLSKFSDIIDINNTAHERWAALGNTIARINGRDATNAFTKGFLQNIGDWVIKSKIISAEAGDKSSIDLLKHVNPDWEPGTSLSSADIDKMSSSFAGMIHGTHDPRTLPGWMLKDTAVQPFFQLASWNIAQTNAWLRHVWTPAKQGNITPFLMSTLGSLGGGYVISKLREAIGDKKSPIPDISEIANSSKGIEGNIPLDAYKAMALASYVGFGGILSTAAKAAGDIAFKNIPQSATFPLDEVMSTLVHRPMQAISALINDPNIKSMDDYTRVVSKLATDLVKENIQFGRIAVSWAARDKDLLPNENYYKELNKKNTELRRFKMAEGLPYEFQTASTGNPYMDLGIKQFKHTQDLGEAAGEARGLIQGSIQNAQGNPDVMRSKLHALKSNVYETMPDPDTQPLIFKKYRDFLEKEVGPEETNDMIRDYFIHKAFNSAKSAMIPTI